MDNNYKQQFQDKLAREYTRYTIVQYFIKLSNFPKYTSWLEKLLLLMGSIKSKNRQDEIFLLDNILVQNYFVELEHHITKDELKHIKKSIYGKIEEFYKTSKHILPNYKVEEKNDIYFVTCGLLNKRISKQRIIALQSMMEEKYKPFFTELLIICCLRYECVLSFISQWSMPLDYYKYIYNNYNVRFETHSSPFNCQLMMISNKIGYASLFYDTDKYFGSLGNAMDVDYKTLPDLYCKNGSGIMGISVVPMSEFQYGLRKTFKLMYNNINTNNVLFIMVTNKFDNKYYPKIIVNNALLYEKRLYNGQYYFENTVTDEQTISYNWYNNIDILFVGNKKNFNKSFFGISKSFGIKDKQKDSIYYVHKLKKEYNRYLLVMDMKKLSVGHEWNNIYERFLITMANIKKDQSLDNHDYLFADVPLTHDVYKTMELEMTEKKIGGIKTILNSIHEQIKNFLVIDFNESYLKYYQNDDEYVCEDFKITLGPTRRIALIKRLGASGKAKYFLELLLILCIRYNCLALGGQQWNLPHKLYSYLNNKYNLQLECFASPLNSQLVLLDKKARFCSLFYDTDKYFGSYGNLFETNIVTISSDFNGVITMSLFPPNIEDIIYKMIDLVNKWFTYVPKLRVFTGLLKWINFPPMQLLSDHKNLKYIREYQIGEYYFENSISQDVPKILKPGKNPYIMYVLANFDLLENEPPYKTIDEYMRPY